MRKLLIALALAFAAVVGVTGGANSARADDQGADWLATGTGTTVVSPPFSPAMVHVNAQSGFGGANARGHFWIRYPDGGGEFGGPVVCLYVQAKREMRNGRRTRNGNSLILWWQRGQRLHFLSRLVDEG